MSEQARPDYEEELAADASATHTDPANTQPPQEENIPEAGEQAQDGDDPALVELQGLRKQAEESQERYLRTQADFDNFRRRSRLEKEDFAKYASSKLVEQLLPVLDNFERAIAASKDSKDLDSLLKGIEMIQRQMGQVLEQEGLKPLDSIGQLFNPEFHQAIMQVDSDEHEEGTIVEELQKGYAFKDKVLRPAMVKVTK